MQIADAMNSKTTASVFVRVNCLLSCAWVSIRLYAYITASGGSGLWSEEDGLYYDRIRFEDGSSHVLKVTAITHVICVAI